MLDFPLHGFRRAVRSGKQAKIRNENMCSPGIEAAIPRFPNWTFKPLDNADNKRAVV